MKFELNIHAGLFAFSVKHFYFIQFCIKTYNIPVLYLYSLCYNMHFGTLCILKCDRRWNLNNASLSELHLIYIKLYILVKCMTVYMHADTPSLV